jgi:hypothetical protein
VTIILPSVFQQIIQKENRAVATGIQAEFLIDIWEKTFHIFEKIKN